MAGPTSPNFESDNLAVLLDGFTADVLVPSFGNVTVTNCTIAAWVNDPVADSRTIRPSFIIAQSSVFGLTIWSKQLWGMVEIHLECNGSYNNNTGLILPTNQWAFVAMVINPTNATIYLQNGTGMSSTNFAGTYPPQSFAGNSYIGWDTAGSATGAAGRGRLMKSWSSTKRCRRWQSMRLYLGVPASATLTIAPSGGNLMLTWPGGTLLEAPAVTGPWTTNSAAVSPYPITPTAAQKYYRVQLQ